jgi:hypothetical protein
MIARWKGIIEEIHFWGSIMPSDIIGNINIENPSFRPSKWLRKLKPAKNNKLSKLPECCFEPVGKAGWPSISRNMISRWKGDPDLCRNTMKYRNTHKRRDAAEIRLHFIDNK